jgi:hypothetical protein
MPKRDQNCNLKTQYTLLIDSNKWKSYKILILKSLFLNRLTVELKKAHFKIRQNFLDLYECS